MPSELDNNNHTPTKINAWLDELLVKDQTGKLQSFHKAQDTMFTLSPESDVKDSLQDDIEVAGPILPTVYVSPQDDSFHFLGLVGQPQDQAQHIFHPDDERHLQEAAARLAVDDSKKYSLEKIVDKLLEKQAWQLDLDNKKNLTDWLYDFFRNRKNSLIVREYLSKLQIAGKLIDSKQLDTILSIVKTIKANIEVAGGLVVRASEMASSDNFKVNTVKPIIKKPIVKTVVTPIQPVSQNKTEVKPPVVKTDLAAVPKPVSQPLASVVVTPKIEVAPITKPTVNLPKVSRPQNNISAKPTMADVTTQKVAPTKVDNKRVLVGPVDELANMSLDNFRRLGPDAASRAQRIYEKIAVLEKDSVSKKAAGIAAWRQSPVYSQYLDLGASSLMGNQDIVNLINQRQQAGTQVLSLEEFNTVGDLNRLLRF